MRNWYNRKWLVLHEPITERSGRTFERKLAEVEGKGFKMVGQPTFLNIPTEKICVSGYTTTYVVFGTVLMRKA
jgi:hypothetical protein